MFAPQAQDLLEKLAEILLYNFDREHILQKLKTKKLSRKIKSKNLPFGPVPLKQVAEILATNGSDVNSPAAVSFTVLSQTPRGSTLTVAQWLECLTRDRGAVGSPASLSCVLEQDQLIIA